MARSLRESWAYLSHVPLRAEASDRSECVNEVLAGETVSEIEQGEGNWVKVELPDGYQGWMDRRQLKPVTSPWVGQPMRLPTLSSEWRGVAGGWLPAGACVRHNEGRWFLGEDEVEPLGEAPTFLSCGMHEWAMTMKGVPYHWGGRSGWGFDCSGLVSLAAALVGMRVPRDASQQAKVGTEVPLDAIQADDIAFFQNNNGAITHVGICNGQGEVIHASGEVRIDQLRGAELLRHEDCVKSHSLSHVMRWRESMPIS